MRINPGPKIDPFTLHAQINVIENSFRLKEKSCPVIHLAITFVNQ